MSKLLKILCCINDADEDHIFATLSEILFKVKYLIIPINNGEQLFALHHIAVFFEVSGIDAALLLLHHLIMMATKFEMASGEIDVEWHFHSCKAMVYQL